MNILTDERKNFLESALLEKGATKKFLSDIDNLQELIFLIAVLNERSDKNVGFNIADSRELIYKHLLEKVSRLPEYFLIADPSSRGLLINNSYADLFSCREFAESAVKRYSDMGIVCSVFQPEDTNIFEYLYYRGIKYIMIDQTETTYSIAVKRSEIIPNSRIKKSADCTTDNPALRFAIANFYCSMHHQQIFRIDDKKLTNLQNLMIYHTANAKFLVPVKHNSENPDKAVMATTKMENQGNMLTVFTDKPQFDKFYPHNDWDYAVLDFDNVCAGVISGKCHGIVINPSEERLSVDRAVMAHIRKTAKNMTLKS